MKATSRALAFAIRSSNSPRDSTSPVRCAICRTAASSCWPPARKTKSAPSWTPSPRANFGLILRSVSRRLCPIHPPPAASKSGMTDPAVSLRNVTKIFQVPWQRRPVVALHDLNLEVAAGQIYGLLGPNGSGKSTTLKIILGLVTPTRGEARIFGRDSERVASHESVGFLPEIPDFYKYLTGEETLRFYGKLCGLRGTELKNRIAELLDLVGLTSAGGRRLSGYSKGMLQRIGLAQALVQDPALLVLDEPTAGVDPAGSREIRDLILRFKSQGITVLLCSHLLSQVQEICDRVGILHQGVLVREGALHELISIRSRTELILENASPELLARIREESGREGAQIVEERQPQ